LSQIYDVFLSYAWTDKDAVDELDAALRQVGLKVFRDLRDIQTWASITESISTGLAHSRALVAYYSREYPRRRACQWELITAVLAEADSPHHPNRILVVNPDQRSGHIQPASLRDVRFSHARAIGDAPGVARLAQSIAAHVAGLEGVFGDRHLFSPPRWLPAPRIGSSRFVGRLDLLLEIHGALHSAGQISSGSTMQCVLIKGLAGIGKSLLVEEYALQFGAAFPGGVFWLSAGGDGEREPSDPQSLEASLHEQLREIAGGMAIPCEGLPSAEVRGRIAAAIETREGNCLWIIDDIPGWLDRESIRPWLSPHPMAKTIVTSRGTLHALATYSILLGELSHSEGLDLLTTRRIPETPAELAAAAEIVDALGGHPLAIDVAGAALAIQRGLRSFAEYRDDLRREDVDVLELAAHLADDIPKDGARSVAAALLRSIEQLGRPGTDILRIAKSLALAAIPSTLIYRAFLGTDGHGEDSARAVTALGLEQLISSSLAQQTVHPPGVLVHPLVSRTMQFHDHNTEPSEALQSSLLDALKLQTLAKSSADWKELRNLLPHVRFVLDTQGEPAREPQLLLWLIEYDYDTGAYASSERLSGKFVRSCRGLLGADHTLTLQAEGHLALAIREQGRYEEARKIQERILTMLQHEPVSDPLVMLQATCRLAWTLKECGQPKRALELYKDAVDQLRVAVGSDDSNTLSAMGELAVILRATGNLTAARHLHEEVVAIRSRDSGRDDPQTLRAISNLAVTTEEQGDLDYTRELLEGVVADSRRVLGDDHPITLAAMTNLSVLRVHLGDVDGSLELQRTVLDGYRRTHGDAHPKTFSSMSNLAMALRLQGDLDQALELEERAVTGLREIFGDKNIDTLRARSEVAATRRVQGDTKGAQQIQESVVSTSGAVFGEESADTLAFKGDLAETLLARGELDRAIAILEEVSDGLRRVRGESHRLTLLVDRRLGVARQAKAYARRT
jgi:tetratricopeptide (TPR) repeat protein